MALLDNILSYHRVVGGVHVDQDASPLANGVNTGSPATSAGVSGESFIDYNGTDQYSRLPRATMNAAAVNWAFAFRFKTAVMPAGNANHLVGMGSTTDADPWVSVRGNGTNSLEFSARNDTAGGSAIATTAVNANLFNGTERIAIVSHNAATSTVTIKELTLGLSASGSTAALGVTTITNFGVGAWARAAPPYFADVDISWVAQWDRTLTAQDEADLVAGAWPFAAVPNPTLTDTLLDAEASNAPLINETGLTVHVYDVDGGTLLYTTTAATTDANGVFTIDDDLVGAVDDTVFVIVRPSAGRPVCGTMTVTNGNA